MFLSILGVFLPHPPTEHAPTEAVAVAKDDKTLLQGRWEQVNDLKNGAYEFKGSTMIHWIGAARPGHQLGDIKDGIYQFILYPDESPKRIVWSKGGVIADRGHYKIEGNRFYLRQCYTGPIPNDFNDPPEVGLTFIYEKVR